MEACLKPILNYWIDLKEYHQIKIKYCRFSNITFNDDEFIYDPCFSHPSFLKLYYLHYYEIQNSELL